jgi:outer membrane immunogenic protein
MIDCEYLMKRLGPGVAALGVAAMAAAFAAAPARAADLPAPAPGYYPPVYKPALYDWTGLYFGGHAGAGLLSDSSTQNGVSAGGTNLNSTITIGPVGLVAGGQLGANFQFASWVVGAEASWSGTTISGSGTGLTTVGNTERMTSAVMDFATATGRVGYAFNAILPYVKGGAAAMQVHYTQDLVTPAGTIFSQEIKDTRSGFTVGAGVEYGLTENFSAKLEYDFYNFGTKSYNFATTPVAIQSSMHVLEFGLNYRFNWVR